MSLLRLVIKDLRCIDGAELAFPSRRALIVGPNGAGKTTLLEAIYLLGRGRSFRTRQTRQLIRHGTDGFTVFGELGTSVAGVSGRIGIGFQSGGLEARIDGKPAESLADLARRLPVHVVDPRVHHLIEAGPTERRRFLDAGVFHVEHGYLASWRSYRRALSQRNGALKAGRADTLEAWTTPLVEAAEAVDSARAAYVATLAEAVETVGRRLLGAGIKIGYERGWRAEEPFGDALARLRARDLQTGVTQVGPHRADLLIGFDAGAVRDLASRGQQKLVAAALVLGQVTVFEQLSGGVGTLLVDDPAAELDDASLERLLEEVDRLRAQQIVTGLRLESLRAGSADTTFHVKQGIVKQML